jgi:hypothetical protein
MTKATQIQYHMHLGWVNNSPNQPSLNPTHQRLSTNIKSVAKISYNSFCFDLNLNFNEFLFNIQMTSQP